MKMNRERLKFLFKGKFPFVLLCGLVITVSTLCNAFADASNDMKLLFLGNKNIAPVVYLDGNTPSGIAVDIVHALAEHIPQPIEIKAMDWLEAQALVARGQADALIQINATEERKKKYDFSDPLLESHVSIFARADKMGISGLSSLHGLRVGVESGGLPQMLLKKDPQIRLTIIANFSEGFKQLNEGSIAAVVVDYWVGSYILSENRIRNIKAAGDPIQSSYSSIAVKKGNAKLLNEINNALQIIKADGTYQKIIDNWKPKMGVFQTYEQIKERMYFVAILILLVLFLIAVIGMLTVKKELTKRKTAEEKLREQYSTLRSIINSANAPIFSVDRQYRYTSFNTAHAALMQALYGAKLNIGHSLLAYMTVPEDSEAARRNLDRALAGEQIMEEAYSGDELRSRQYFQVSHSPVRTETGEIIGVAVLSQDLTARKQAEEETNWNLAINQALSSLYKPLVTADASIEQIAGIILEISRQLTGSAHGFVAEIDPSSADLIAHTLTRMMPAECQVAEELRTIRFPRRADGLYSGLWGHALNTREPFYANAPGKHTASVGIPEGHIVIERYLAVPVLLSGELVGQIALSNSVRDFSDRDVHAIQRIAEFYALAIQQNRTEEELARYRGHLEELVQARTAQLEETRNRARQYLDIAGVILVAIDTGQRVTLINQKGCEVLQSTSGEIIGKDWFQTFVPEDIRRDVLQTFRRLMAGQLEPVEYFENPVLTQGGQERLIAWHNVLLRDGEGHITGTLSSGTDITEQRRAEKQIISLNQDLQQRAAALKAANTELDAFAFTVSHDLRAPLRHMDGFIKLLQKNAGTVIDEQGRHYMAAISDSAQKLGLLIDDLLSFSRMGLQAMAFQQVELGIMVRDVIRELEPDTDGRDIEWRIGDLPQASGDASMLRIVLSNLIANALKFTQPRQQAQIEIGSLPDQVSGAVIFVRDNGVGFDMAYVDKLFGVFQRLHRADEFEGTGIGLANVRRIIARHGGRAWAEGKVDQGATFYFSLPFSL